MLKLEKCFIKPCPGHRYYLPVYTFRRGMKYLTSMYDKNSRVLVTTNNDLLADYISKETKSDVQVVPLLVPRALSDSLGIDLVVLMNMYCDRINKQNIYDLYYIVPSKQSIPSVRTNLIEQELNGNL